MSLHWALVWLAQRWQVNRPESIGAWCVRAFWKPSARQPVLAVDPARVPDPIAWLATTWGVEAGAPLWQWLWRVLVLPPQVTHGGSTAGFGLWASLGQTLRLSTVWVWRVVVLLLMVCTWPLRQLMVWLDSLATHINPDRVDAAAHRVLLSLIHISEPTRPY